MDTFGGPPTEGEFYFLIGFSSFLTGVLVGFMVTLFIT